MAITSLAATLAPEQVTVARPSASNLDGPGGALSLRGWGIDAGTGRPYFNPDGAPVAEQAALAFDAAITRFYLISGEVADLAFMTVARSLRADARSSVAPAQHGPGRSERDQARRPQTLASPVVPWRGRVPIAPQARAGPLERAADLHGAHESRETRRAPLTLAQHAPGWRGQVPRAPLARTDALQRFGELAGAREDRAQRHAPPTKALNRRLERARNQRVASRVPQTAPISPPSARQRHVPQGAAA